MKLLIFLVSILAAKAAHAHAGGGNSSCHDGVYLQGQCYDKQTILTDRPFINAFAINHQTDTLYFHYQHDKDSYKLARLNLKTNEIRIRSYPHFVYSLAANSKYKLYIGTEDMIYYLHLDWDIDIIVFSMARNRFISTLFLKDDLLYFCDHYSLRQYALEAKTGKSVRLRDLEDVDAVHFVLDNDNNMFYNNESALFRQKKGTTTSEAVKYEKLTSNGFLYGLTLDLHGNLYASFTDGVYSVRKDDNKVDLVVDHQVDGVAFDSNNHMIYCFNSSVVRLVPRLQDGSLT